MEKFLINYINKIGIQLSQEQAKSFIIYMNELTECNKVMNLTAITDPKEIVIKHFADSLLTCKAIDLSNKNVIDVGTGAGFPGLPIKIALQDVKLTLLDALLKRIDFLQNVCEKTNISDVTFIHSRAEDGARDSDLRESFDAVVSRAVAPLNILCEYDLPFVKKGGYFIALKSKDTENEVKNAQTALKELGGKVIEIKNYILPDTDIDRSIIIIEKEKETPEKYPRRAKKISTKPLV